MQLCFRGFTGQQSAERGYVCIIKAMSSTAGKHMTSESDFTHASADAGTVYIVMLAIDSMLAIINGLETLTMKAIQSSEQPGAHADNHLLIHALLRVFVFQPAASHYQCTSVVSAEMQAITASRRAQRQFRSARRLLTDCPTSSCRRSACCYSAARQTQS